MKTARENTKENIFGIKDRTPGQNLMRAVTNSDQPIGIPPYDYDKMLDILYRALDPDEVELLRRGYGIGRKRQTQKDIAVDLHMDPSEVSAKAHGAVRKLQASPYKAQLRALISSREDLFTIIIDLRNENRSLRESKAGKKALKKLKRRMEALSAENASLRNSIQQMKEEIAIMQTRVADSKSQASRERARAEAIKQAFDETINAASVKFAAAVSNAEETSVNATDERKEGLQSVG